MEETPGFLFAQTAGLTENLFNLQLRVPLILPEARISQPCNALWCVSASPCFPPYLNLPDLILDSQPDFLPLHIPAGELLHLAVLESGEGIWARRSGLCQQHQPPFPTEGIRVLQGKLPFAGPSPRNAWNIKVDKVTKGLSPPRAWLISWA